MRTDFLQGYSDFFAKLAIDFTWDADTMRKQLAAGTFDQNIRAHVPYYGNAAHAAPSAGTPASAAGKTIVGRPPTPSVRPPPGVPMQTVSAATTVGRRPLPTAAAKGLQAVRKVL